MIPSNTTAQDDFVEDDFVPDQDDFQADDFVPDEPKAKKREPHPNPANEFLIRRGEEHLQEGKPILETAKGLVSGATAGLSRLVPGLKPEGGEGTAGEIVGSFLPISRLIKGASVPLRALASKSPILRNQLQSFANLVGVGTAGAIYGGLEQATESGELKAPSAQDLLNHGATWALIDATLQGLGWTGRFAKALTQKAKSSGKPVNEVLESTIKKVGLGDNAAEKAIADLEGKSLYQITKEVNATDKAAMETLPQQVEQRAADLKKRKIEQKDFTRLEEGMPAQAKPYLPAEFEADKIAEEAISQDLNQKVENVAQRAGSERELGQNIKADLEREIEFSKAYTDELYDTAKKVEGTVSANLERTADAMLKELQKIQKHGFKTKPEGYAKVEKQLVGLLEDMGFGVTQDAEGMIENIVLDKPITLEAAVELKKRLNKIINYDLIETGAQDFLKGPAAALRQDIRSGYGPKESVARKAFEKAETVFGQEAEKKGKKSITNMRLTEKPESIAKVIKTPSGLADVKDVVSKEQFAQIERELLEHMKALNEDRAAKFYRELRPSLTPDARAIAEEIIASKAPATSPTRRVAQRNKIQEMVLDDFAKASVTGQRADKALDLWKTEIGQQLIKHVLEDNPNKKEILKYLTDQSFNDFHTSIVSPDGKINFKKMNELLRDPATAENIRMVAGEEGLSFLKQLEQLTERFNRNKGFVEGRIDKGSRKERKEIANEIENLGKERFKKGKEKRANLTKEEQLAEEAKEKSGLIYKFDDLLNSYGVKAKGLLTALGIINIGLVPGLALAGGWEAFFRLSKNKNVRELFKKAAGPRKNSVPTIRAIDAFMKAEDGND